MKRIRIILTLLLIVFTVAIVVLLAILLGLVAVRSPQASEDVNGLSFVRAIYAFGPDSSQLITPASVAFVPGSTDIWCADQANYRLVGFNFDGTYRSLFFEDSDGEGFDFPSDIAISNDGWFYVAQSSYNKVTVYNPQRGFEQKLESPSPMSVAVSDDLVVVGCVPGFALFTRDGTYLKWVGTRGSGDDQFDTINGVALDDEDNIYIVDTYNNRLSKYSKDAVRIWMVSLGPAGNATTVPTATDDATDFIMQTPMGLTIDGAGRIVLIDNQSFSIAAFDAHDGHLLGTWGGYGSGDGQLLYPADISYNARTDTFVIADTGNSRLQIVRIPESGAHLAAGLERNVRGPLRACLIPFLVVFLTGSTLTLYFVGRKKWRTKRASVSRTEDFNEN